MTDMSRKDWPVVLGCWIWQKHTDKRDGRALTWRGNKPYAAYKEVYEKEVGPVPDGLVLDHGCAVPQCVAPHHLAPVTKSENEKRKRFRHRIKQTRCPAGHDLTLHRIITGIRSGTVCRLCNHESESRQGSG
jgi:hypothetical protein